jgi:chromosome segregation ATPase
LLENTEELRDESEKLKLENQRLRKAATERDKALGQIEQHVARTEELEGDVRRVSKQLIDKDRAVAEGKLAAAELLEAQRHVSDLEKRNQVLEKDVARYNEAGMDLNVKLAEVKTALNLKKTQVDCLEKEVGELREELELEQKRSARAKAEKNAEFERASELEGRAEELEREFARLNTSVGDLANQRQQLLEQTEKDTAELEAEREEVRQVEILKRQLCSHCTWERYWSTDVLDFLPAE